MRFGKYREAETVAHLLRGRSRSWRTVLLLLWKPVQHYLTMLTIASQFYCEKYMQDSWKDMPQKYKQKAGKHPKPSAC